MDKIKSSAEVAARLGAIGSLNPHDLSGIERAVGRLMSKWPNDRGIYLQLQRLAAFIAKTRQELATLRPSEVKQEFIPKATDELDAIVEATASATHRIMDAADVIMDVAGRLAKEDSDKAMAAVTSIYEACTFQDITGQRVTKVVNMLKVIEERIDKMVAALGEFNPSPGEPVADDKSTPGEFASGAAASQGDIDAMFAADIAAAEPVHQKGSVLDGPALPGKGKSQADVDAILSGES